MIPGVCPKRHTARVETSSYSVAVGRVVSQLRSVASLATAGEDCAARQLSELC